MYSGRFEFESFETADLSDRLEVLRAMLEAFTLCNGFWIAKHPDTPALYESGVTYALEKAGDEAWSDIPRMRITRVGDCKDLCPWRMAEMRAKGEKGATFFLRRFRIETKYGPQIDYHVQIRHADGTIEDPSALLGMNQVHK